MANLTGVPYLPPIVNLPIFNVATFPEATSYADVGVLKGIYQDTTTNQVLVSSNTVKATSLAKLYSYPIATNNSFPLSTTATIVTIPAIIPLGVQALVYVSINLSTPAFNRAIFSMTVGLSTYYTQTYSQLVNYTGTNNIQIYMSNQFMFPITGTGNAINVTLNVTGTGPANFRLNSSLGLPYTNLNPSDIQVVLL